MVQFRLHMTFFLGVTERFCALPRELQPINNDFC